MTLYMKYKRTERPSTAAARAGFSVATAYRIEQNPHLPSSKKAPRERRHSYLMAEIFEAEIVPLQQSGPCFVWGDASRHLQDTIRPTRPLKRKPQIHPRRQNSLFDPDCAPDAPLTGHANNRTYVREVRLADSEEPECGLLCSQSYEG